MLNSQFRPSEAFGWVISEAWSPGAGSPERQAIDMAVRNPTTLSRVQIQRKRAFAEQGL